MNWLKQKNTDKSNKRSKALEHAQKTRGKISNLMRAQCLFPEALEANLNFYQALMHGDGELTRAEREMIALVVSATNNCTYSVSHAANSLAKYENDNNMLKEIVAGRQFMGLQNKHAKMLRHAIKLTDKPDKITEADIDVLREAGFSERKILEINLLASYFNFANRVACGLGVDFDSQEIDGYKE